MVSVPPWRDVLRAPPGAVTGIWRGARGPCTSGGVCLKGLGGYLNALSGQPSSVGSSGEGYNKWEG